MERAAIKQLVAWKQKARRKPLMLRGARQTGKTWLLEEFGRRQYDDTLVISFDSNKRVQAAWEPDLDPHRIVKDLERLTGTRIVPDKTLIVFDEIQDFPPALASLKHFSEQAPEYHLACAGSYLGIALHEGASFPVGKVQFVDMHPMSFNEYLLAIGATDLLDHLDIGNFSRLHLLAFDYVSALKDYFFLGGMPEVVQTFLDTRDMNEARAVQQDILTAYDHDFSKHAPAVQIPRIRALWNSIPAQLGKENRKFTYSLMEKSARAREYETAMLWMLDTNIAHKVNRVTDIRLPLNPYRDERAFKLYCCDIGLYSCMSGLPHETLADGSDLFVEFKGSLAEQFVLQQMLAMTDLDPFYWANASGRAEVDFVVQTGGSVIPIEVKSGTHLLSRSLKAYREKFGPPRSLRLSLAEPFSGREITDLPLYAISLLPDVLAGGL
ncbi:MAG: ATP-binding protein [Coriobacteriales bacterium]|jgi:predicted AAA+ superfamily ATPase|nr:ATP-binding protein [Coriobacteriales bacterium]